MRWPPLYPKTIYHIVNRGVSKMKLYKKDADYRFFQYQLQKYKEKYQIEILMYCIMPNHFHILIRTQYEIKNISNFMKYLQMTYSRYYNRTYNHKGHVYEGRYKNKNINSQKYLKDVKIYIDQNPVKEGLVNKPENWAYRG